MKSSDDIIKLTSPNNKRGMQLTYIPSTLFLIPSDIKQK